MKYIIINDILETFHKKKYLFITYFVCFIMISFYFQTDSLKMNAMISNSIIGIDFYRDANVVLKLFMLFQFFTYIYIAYYIFIKDMISSYGNIFSRIHKSKWLCSKLVSIMVITFGLKLVSYFIVFLMYHNKIEVYYYIHHLIFIYVYQLVALIVYIVVINVRKVSMYLFIVCLIMIGLLSFDFSMITSQYYDDSVLLIAFIMCIFIYLQIGKKMLGIVLERNG